MEYKVVEVRVSAGAHDQIIAMMMGIGFESFEETDHSILGYIPKDQLDEDLLTHTLSHLSTQLQAAPFEYQLKDLEEKNWNEEWERNFEPVVIDEKVLIKASFHNVEKSYPFEIRINPKMSFGTGHHETTSLMIKLLVDYDLKQKSLLDVGTGTGVLAIMAKLLGTVDVLATDVDDWCIENSKENFSLNGFPEIEVLQGTIDQLEIGRPFDIVLANINKNILLKEIPFYKKLMKPEGLLFLSGFYDSDQKDVEKVCSENNLKLTKSDFKNHWACLIFKNS